MLHRPCSRRRGGVTLVELVAVMIAGSAIMSVTIAAIVGAMKADRQLAHAADAQGTAARMTEQLRRDIHAAAHVVWDEQSGTLSLRMPGGAVVFYQRIEGRFERREKPSDGSEPQLAGAFALSRGSTLTVAPTEAERGGLLSITWSHRTPPAAAAGRREPTQLVATVGRDLELLKD